MIGPLHLRDCAAKAPGIVPQPAVPLARAATSKIAIAGSDPFLGTSFGVPNTRPAQGLGKSILANVTGRATPPGCAAGYVRADQAERDSWLRGCKLFECGAAATRLRAGLGRGAGHRYKPSRNPRPRLGAHIVWAELLRLIYTG